MKKIVLIEDDQMLGQNIVEILTEAGFDLKHATNGEMGIEMVKKFLPDLVISDILMPEKDGLELKIELNDDPVTSTIPFIFLTAKTDKSDIRRGMGLGADDYLTKPFSNEDLLNSINSRIKKNETIKKHSDELGNSIATSLPMEVNNPLASILGYSELMMDMEAKLNENNCYEAYLYAQIINSSGLELLKLLKRFLLVAKLETIFSNNDEIRKYRENDKRLFMSEELKKNIATLSENHYENRIVIQNNVKNTIINISEEDAGIVVKELLDNAYRFGSKNTNVYVTEEICDGNYCMIIKNYGSGMTKEQISKIGLFRRFNKNGPGQKGIGIGLEIARKIIDLNNGVLKIECINKAETIVTISIPRVGNKNDEHSAN